ncbi:MAG: DNA repair protein RecN [Polyangia bacterium]
MLAQLRVRDLVLIDELDLELADGFNVLTGETGAGKSLVATALDILLGRRARSDLVRKGAAEAEVEGLFDISDEPAVRGRLEEAGLPCEDELLIRRLIPASGRHRCYVNGKLSSLSVLAQLAEGLASVTSQHAHHALLEPAAQLALLDGFGSHGELLAQMAEANAGARRAAERYRELAERERDRAGRLDYLEFQLAEIERLDPSPGELSNLETEIERLRHCEELLTAARGGAEELYEADGSIYERLGASLREIEDAARHDPALGEEAAQLSEAAVLIEDTARRLATYGSGLEADPERLELLEDRREELRRLTRKHDTDCEGLIDLRESLAREKAELERYEESLAEAAARLESARGEASERAAALTRARRKAAARLARAATRELSDLAFDRAELSVRLQPREGDPGPSGADRVELEVEINPGEGSHPLRRVASGGELSRLMLALRRVLAGVGPVGTYVFDEVDAGIGGAVAATVGRKLREVASHHQVICITHLPQISGMADAHFVVSKVRSKRRTVTRVDRVDGRRRVDELARMLGGEEVTDAVRDAARELLAAGP